MDLLMSDALHFVLECHLANFAFEGTNTFHVIVQEFLGGEFLVAKRTFKRRVFLLSWQPQRSIVVFLFVCFTSMFVDKIFLTKLALVPCGVRLHVIFTLSPGYILLVTK